MKFRFIPVMMLAAGLATSCANEEVLEVNTDPTGSAISFSPKVGRATKATETTVSNLGNFAVVARGVHPHGDVYSNFLIGNANGGEVATRPTNVSGTTGVWTLDHNVLWPSSIDNMLFWAYTASNNTSDEMRGNLLGGATFSFIGNTPKISGFLPKKSDLTKVGESYYFDGVNQEDLMFAFTSQKRTESASNVSLNFQHALTQISIEAKSAGKTDGDHRIVKIKGAWIVNAKDKGELAGDFKWDNSNKEATSDPYWTASFSSNDITAYGSFYKNEQLLDDATKTIDLLKSGSNQEPSLMLIPQDFEAWDAEASAEDIVKNTNGVYIMLLCRVELRHDGSNHSDEGGDSANDDVLIDEKNDKHYHQQFPVNKENKYDATEYGFVCVPITAPETTVGDAKEKGWQMGTKYKYTLDICGAASGAGIYPPDFDENIYKKLLPSDYADYLTIGTRPTETDDDDNPKKKVGDPVLDSEIKFTVSVKEWGEWVSGNEIVR
ncbi:MAG: fimbrillin family protein [Muribaculaceae bacterium]|nr:fimbrillin family protein [Muribaculaceae bacterium]